MGRARIYVTALTVLLIPAGAGVVTLHASPTCQKFVRTYVTVPVRNRVSKATAAAWAKWRIGHPNWKPNPHVKRPRYRMSTREALEKVAFACEVPTDPRTLDILFTPTELFPPEGVAEVPESAYLPPPVVVPPIETTSVSVPDTIPPLVAENPPYANIVFPPGYIIPPYLPPVYGGYPGTGGGPRPAKPPVVTPVVPVVPIAPTPEPSSLVLMLLGAGAAVPVLRRRYLLR